MEPPSDNASPAPSIQGEGGVAHLTRIQATLAAELNALDPSLQGMYLQALRLLPSASEPGIPYLICHVGRELSRGVLAKFAAQDLDGVAVREAPETEKNRDLIAQVLGLPFDHPIVTDWFRLAGFFVQNVHYQVAVAEGRAVTESFAQFEQLLFMTVAPYFDAKPELDRLLQVSRPTPEDIHSVKAVLARRALRRRFFSQCSQPGWARPLLDLGIFDSPPATMALDSAGGASPYWDAGAFLARVAAGAPDVATTVFTRIGSDTRNPQVWREVVEAAESLPVEPCTTIAVQMGRALRHPAPVVFDSDLVRFCARLALLKSTAAIMFVDKALALRQLDASQPNLGDAAQHTQRRAAGGHTFRHLANYHFEHIVDEVVPVLQAWQPLATLDLLIRKLRATAYLEREGKPEHPGDSRRWCRRVDRRDHHTETAGVLAHTVYQSARAIALDVTSAREVFARLLPATSGDEVCLRIAIRLLADVGHFVPDRIDSLLTSDDAIAPAFGVAEVATALRHAMRFGSPGARRVFRYALERGPGLDEVAWSWRHAPFAQAAEEELDISGTVARWQQDRLAWFHDQLPEELRGLAAAIGHEPRVPSAREQALMEDGFWVGSEPSRWESDVSPVSSEELSQMTSEEVWEFVVTWKPGATAAAEERASVRELMRTLSQFVASTPSRLGDLVASAVRRGLPAETLLALCRGVREVLKAGGAASSEAVLAIAEHAIVRAADAEEPELWAETTAEVLEAVGKVAAKGQLAPKERERAWAVVSAAIGLGARLDSRKPIQSIGDMLVAADSRVSGLAVGALVELMLLGVRLRADGQGDSDSEADTLRFEGLLRMAEARGGVGATAAIGRYLNWIVAHAPNWVQEYIDGCLAIQDLTDLLKAPGWSVFLVTSRYYRGVFNVIRPLLAASAERAEGRIDDSDERWSFTTALVEYVTEAMLDGQVAVGGADRLLEKTFELASPKQRGKAYWLIWRNLQVGLTEQIDRRVPHVLAFWDYRLSELEASGGAECAAEAKKLSWLVLSDRLPAAQTLTLAERTLRLSGGELQVHEGFWRAVESFSSVDQTGSLNLAELAIQAILRSPWLRLPLTEISPFLRACISSTDAEVAARARRLVHYLGDQGYDELGAVLA